MSQPLESFSSPSNRPLNLKDGDFVAVCPHLPIAGFPIWGAGGKASNQADDLQIAYFHFSVMCPRCASTAVDHTKIEFRRAKFYDEKLNFGWWEFQPNRDPGRPKKK